MPPMRASMCACLRSTRLRGLGMRQDVLVALKIASYMASHVVTHVITSVVTHIATMCHYACCCTRRLYIVEEKNHLF